MLRGLCNQSREHFLCRLKTTYIQNHFIHKIQRLGRLPYMNYRSYSHIKLDAGVTGLLATSSVMGRQGDTVVHIAIVNEPKYDATDGLFLPLMVDYRVRSHAYGTLPSNRSKREVSGSEEELLCARVIDRSIRPLFQKGYVDDIQITATVHSIDASYDPIVTTVNATSLALLKSGLPWDGPIGCCRVGMINGVLKANPSLNELKSSKLDLLYSGTKENCIMMEVSAMEIPEEVMKQALLLAQKTVVEIIDHQQVSQLEQLQQQLEQQQQQQQQQHQQLAPPVPNNPINLPPIIHKVPEELYKFVEEKGLHLALETFRNSRHLPRKARSKLEGKLNYDLKTIIKQDPNWSVISSAVSSIAVHDVMSKAFRQSITETVNSETISDLSNEIVSKRVDGRKLDEIRPITMEVGNFPDIVHGSSIFRRGETHVVATTTLGSIADVIPHTYNSNSSVSNNNKTRMMSEETEVEDNVIDSDDLDDNVSNGDDKVNLINKKSKENKTMDVSNSINSFDVKNFILHYDFPTYSTGSIGFSGSVNRRMIGHGKLAEKALKSLIPLPKDFPYTIRVFCECTSSNGSSSMASICGASLALLDAGVPLKSIAAGVSIGLITDTIQSSTISESIESTESTTSTQISSTLLTDLIGQEDHYGDMDFKVAGTKHGISAIQLDGKLSNGIPLHTLFEALERAKIGRYEIIDKMMSSIVQIRKGVKSTAPLAELVPFNEERKRFLIGPGGDMLKFISQAYNVDVEIFDYNNQSTESQILDNLHVKQDNCYAYIYGHDRANVLDAKILVQDLVCLVKLNDVFTSEILAVRDFGLHVKLTRAQEAYLHISELSWDPVITTTDLTQIFSAGQRIDVKVVQVDSGTGNIKVSRKVMMEESTSVPDLQILSSRLHYKAISVIESSNEVQTDSSIKPIGSLPNFPIIPPKTYNKKYFQERMVSKEEINLAMEKMKSGQVNIYTANNKNINYGNNNSNYNKSNRDGSRDSFEKPHEVNGKYRNSSGSRTKNYYYDDDNYKSSGNNNQNNNSFMRSDDFKRNDIYPSHNKSKNSYPYNSPKNKIFKRNGDNSINNNNNNANIASLEEKNENTLINGKTEDIGNLDSTLDVISTNNTINMADSSTSVSA